MSITTIWCAGAPNGRNAAQGWDRFWLGYCLAAEFDDEH